MTGNKRKINPEHLPIAAVIILLPIVTRMSIIKVGLESLPWFPYEMENRADFFLYYKSTIIIMITVLMLLLLLDAVLIRGKKMPDLKIWMPLFLYEGLAVLSTIFSKYRDYSLHGMMEHFESIWVLLCYGMIAIYTYAVIKEEEDFEKILQYFMISALFQGILGIFQLIGHDLLSGKLIRELIVPEKYEVWKEQLVFNFSSETYQKVSGTLYNPNYAGTFFAMALAVGMMLTLKKRGRKRIFPVIVTGVSLVCLIGTGSKSGAIAFFLSLVIMTVISARKDKKNIRYGLLAGIAFVLCFVLYDCVTGQHTLERIQQSVKISDQEYSLQDITVEKDRIKVKISDRQISFFYNEVGTALYLQVLDENGDQLKLISDEKTQTCIPEGKEFKKILFQCYRKDGIPYVAMTYEDIRFLFTNRTEDGSYTYITIWGKPDRIEQAEAIGFKGKETLFTNRGYIWSRTIPLLKKHIVLGSGPDTFLLEFPQNDYVMRANLGTGFFTEILTKPHCMYLQIAVQTGVLSLVAFLTLFGIYLKREWDAKRLIRKNPESRDSEGKNMVREAIFFAVLIYMIAGITNDSMLVIAPIFWVLLGAGLKINNAKEK